MKIVEQQAQQQVKMAEAKQQAAVANASAKRIQADAEAYRISKEAEAEAQAKANQLLAKSVTPDLIRYNAIQKWNGAYPNTLLGGKTEGLILNLPNSGR